MHVHFAQFDIRWNDKVYLVNFVNNHVVVCRREDFASTTYRNTDRKYKPCSTHAMELVRLTFGDEGPKSERSAKRFAFIKPTLKLAGVPDETEAMEEN